MSKNFFTPIQKNISNFLTKMNDVKKIWIFFGEGVDLINDLF